MVAILPSGASEGTTKTQAAGNFTALFLFTGHELTCQIVIGTKVDAYRTYSRKEDYASLEGHQ